MKYGYSLREDNNIESESFPTRCLRETILSFVGLEVIKATNDKFGFRLI